MAGALFAAQLALSVGQSVYQAKLNNEAVKRKNASIAASLGKSLADVAIQSHQQQQQIRDAQVAVKRQGKEASGAVRALALASDTFGGSVDEQQMAVERDTIENTLKLQQSARNTAETFQRAADSTIAQHQAQIGRLGGSGILEGVLGGVQAGIQSGTLNANTLTSVTRGGARLPGIPGTRGSGVDPLNY